MVGRVRSVPDWTVNSMPRPVGTDAATDFQSDLTLQFILKVCKVPAVANSGLILVCAAPRVDCRQQGAGARVADARNNRRQGHQSSVKLLRSN